MKYKNFGHLSSAILRPPRRKMAESWASIFTGARSPPAAFRSDARIPIDSAFSPAVARIDPRKPIQTARTIDRVVRHGYIVAINTGRWTISSASATPSTPEHVSRSRILNCRQLNAFASSFAERPRSPAVSACAFDLSGRVTP